MNNLQSIQNLNIMQKSMQNGTSISVSPADYSKLTANTGLVNISTANSALDGTGTLGTALTAGSDGTIIRSIVIKATAATTQGMVRFFINNGTITTLFREIPIPASVPTSVEPSFQISLMGNFQLNPGYILYASTQNAESFNIIVEGFDWTYPSPLPTDCSNFRQEFANTGISKLSVANGNLNGQGTIVSAFTPSNAKNGATIKSVTVKATGSPSEGMVRLFITPNGGTNYYLFKEIKIDASIQTGIVPAFQASFFSFFSLQHNYALGASTQNNNNFTVIVEGLDWSYPV